MNADIMTIATPDMMYWYSSETIIVLINIASASLVNQRPKTRESWILENHFARLMIKTVVRENLNVTNTPTKPSCSSIVSRSE